MCIAEKPFTKSWYEVQTFSHILMCTLHHPWLRFHCLLQVSTLSVLDAMVSKDALLLMPLYLYAFSLE